MIPINIFQLTSCKFTAFDWMNLTYFDSRSFRMESCNGCDQGWFWRGRNCCNVPNFLRTKMWYSSHTQPVNVAKHWKGIWCKLFYIEDLNYSLWYQTLHKCFYKIRFLFYLFHYEGHDIYIINEKPCLSKGNCNAYEYRRKS